MSRATILESGQQLPKTPAGILRAGAPPPAAGSAATVWQVDHSRTGLRVDGRRFFGTGWFGAGGEQGVGAGLPPNAYLPYIETGPQPSFPQHAYVGLLGTQKLRSPQDLDKLRLKFSSP